MFTVSYSKTIPCHLYKLSFFPFFLFNQVILVSPNEWAVDTYFGKFDKN